MSTKKTKAKNEVIHKIYIQCKQCNKPLIRKRLMVHLKKCYVNFYNESVDSGNMQCTHCSFVSDNEKLFWKHISKAHYRTKINTKIKPANHKQNMLSQKCEACQTSYATISKLWHHIRQEHYNLQAKLPHCDKKKVNQVWFEKVFNSNVVIEIRKTGPNCLVMKKLDDSTSIEVIENDAEIIDLSHLYPTKS